MWKRDNKRSDLIFATYFKIQFKTFDVRLSAEKDRSASPINRLCLLLGLLRGVAGYRRERGFSQVDQTLEPEGAGQRLPGQ